MDESKYDSMSEAAPRTRLTIHSHAPITYATDAQRIYYSSQLQRCPDTITTNRRF